VEAEDLVVNQRRQREVIEQIGKILPNVGVAILAQALVIKAVYLCDLARLMVAAQNRDAVRVADLESNEQGDRLDGVISSVDIVPCATERKSESESTPFWPGLSGKEPAIAYP